MAGIRASEERIRGFGEDGEEGFVVRMREDLKEKLEIRVLGLGCMGLERLKVREGQEVRAI